MAKNVKSLRFLPLPPTGNMVGLKVPSVPSILSQSASTSEAGITGPLLPISTPQTAVRESALNSNTVVSVVLISPNPNLVNKAADPSTPQPSCVPCQCAAISILPSEVNVSILHKECEAMLVQSYTCRRQLAQWTKDIGAEFKIKHKYQC